MSCMYPRKKMKPVKSKKETLKKLVIIGTLFTVNMGLLIASPTLFNMINPVGARGNTPIADVSVYKDKTKYGTCEYIIVETGYTDGGVSVTPRMKPSTNQNGSEHYCY
ncbi:hypothetical protein Kirov_182 [Bacillus phage Kirov]|uniref:Uncharacterized protein n=1 Tax=Bacillus phage Kirov TaxID=2783539 RepID=A0A7U3RX39_9CAUD|nr:hypothetical protein PQE67_gp122 [Bacillus phage Kirov]QOV08381.1 hypothetical protein Kirov_182 [Bacillus phage Kirov]